MNVTLRTIDAHRNRLIATVVATTLAVSVLAAPAARPLAAAGGRTVSVIVRELPGSGDGPERMVEGDVGRHIGIIDGFVAELPERGIAWLEELGGVHSVTPNATVQLHHAVDGYDAGQDLGSMYWIAQEMSGAGE